MWWNLAETAHDRLEELRRGGRPVVARDENVATQETSSEVLQLGLVVATVEVLGRVADDPRPRSGSSWRTGS